MQYLKFATIKLSIFVLFLTVMAHLHYLHSQSVGHDLHCGKHVYAVGNDETADLGQDILLYFVLNILQVFIDWAFFFFYFYGPVMEADTLSVSCQTGGASRAVNFSHFSDNYYP